MFVSRETFNEVQRRLERGEFDTNNIHTATAAFVLGIPSKDVTPAQRQEAKMANYVWLYSREGKVGDAR